MPQVMSNIGDPDALAAEYVLGTLDFDEREQVLSLLSTDASFEAKVKRWERWLGELHLMVEPVEPDPQLWERVRAKLSPAGEDEQAEPAESIQTESSPVPRPEAPLDLPPEPPPVPRPEPPPVPHSEPPPVPPPEPPSVAVAAEPPATGTTEPLAQDSTAAPAVPEPPTVQALVPSPAVATVDALPPVPRLDRAEIRIRRRLAGWRALALLMTLVVLALAGLVATWRFAPDRVPPGLQPIDLMRLVGVTLPTSEPPQRPVPPPESQFDE